ncbi:polyribonucleotide 5'-hydroxyl-kinase [Marchantia polymorpha subsp. ruderalis]|uniref:Protein CLP1 homolog n=2 Tax=Marchantia polymorpha TaxID=3197 RepID=A0AAF6BQK0_MARPO|nr:hypothetical protein MARPO_0016s0080 [Marchantia polymorpha]BBN14284.1 hypothetical protein Mp_6g10380 [Marchantia polymorpha subsp. ruderalis]|eukprot:PTQ45018.1 hypothetical protein MARPO_0016s0080 [Marchantia polymorpha]
MASSGGGGGAGGGGGGGGGNAGDNPIRRFRLQRESELRIEVGWEGSLKVQLLSGSAEIFGTELPPAVWMTFPPAHKIAIFTWSGATVELDGVSEVAYIADETPMVSYVNVHAVLDNRRIKAREAGTNSTPPAGSQRTESNAAPGQGPRVIVVGPTDSGKSSLTRMLLGWAARKSWKPTYVELDIGQGSITIPGTIAATPIEMPVDPIEGVPLEVPLVYFYGHTTPSVNTDLYRALVKELARTLELQFAANADARAAGMVINTMGWVEGIGYELLLHAINTFNADVVLVLGQEKLYSMLKDVLKDRSGVEIVKLYKSGGVVNRNSKYRSRTRVLKTKEYFYGPANDLSPHASVSNFSDLQVFRIGGGPQAPRSALPIGAEPTADPTRVVPVSISRDLMHAVLAVSYAKDPEHLLGSNIAGFIYVTDVDIPRRKITFVAPCPGPLPSNLLLAGSLAWVE